MCSGDFWNPKDYFTEPERQREAGQDLSSTRVCVVTQGGDRPASRSRRGDLSPPSPAAHSAQTGRDSEAGHEIFLRNEMTHGLHF